MNKINRRWNPQPIGKIKLSRNDSLALMPRGHLLSSEKKVGKDSQREKTFRWFSPFDPSF
jgi:hypothetical protein